MQKIKSTLLILLLSSTYLHSMEHKRSYASIASILNYPDSFEILPNELIMRVLIQLAKSTQVKETLNTVSNIASVNKLFAALMHEKVFKRTIAQTLLAVPTTIAQKKAIAEKLQIKHEQWFKEYLTKAQALIHAMNAIFVKPKNEMVLTNLEKLLIEGADINTQSAEGWTILIWAVFWDQEELVKLLLARLADLEVSLINGQTALSIASEYGYAKLVSLLTAVGANLESRTSAGDTPLMRAIAGGYFACIEKLLEAGANPNAQNQQGDTPLIRAVEQFGDNAHIIQLLLNNNANDLQRNNKGQTALDIAIELEDIAVIDLLNS